MIDRYDPDLLLAYIEDELEGDELARFEQMMRDDAQLAELVRGLSSDRALLRSIPEAESPAGLVDDAMHQLERKMLLDSPAEDLAGPIPIQRGRELSAPSNGRPWGRIVGISGMAAAVLIGAGLTYFVFLGDPLNRTALELLENEEEAGATQPAAPMADEAFAQGGADDDSNASSAAPAALNAPAGRGAPAEPRERESADSIAAADAAPAPQAPTAPRSGGLLERAADAILTGPLAPERDSNTRPASEPAPANDRNPARQPGLASPVIALARNSNTEINPDPQLLVYTDAPDITQQQILAFCVANGIPVVEADPRAFADTDDDQARLIADQADPAGFTTQLALLIEDDQLGELVQVVNQVQPPRLNRQRAVVQESGAVLRQQAQLRIADPKNAAETDSEEAPADAPPRPYAQTDGYYQLKAPSDLGDEVLTERNADNVYIFNNRIALDGEPPATEAPARPGDAQAAQPSAMAAPAAEQEAASDEADGEAQDSAEAEDARQERLGPESPREEGVAEDAPAPAQQREAALADRSDTISNDAKPAVRGNYLTPQLPLANTTPIWNEQRRTRIVPIILRFVGGDANEAHAPAADNASEQTESDPAPEAEPAPPAQPAEAPADGAGQ